MRAGVINEGKDGRVCQWSLKLDWYYTCCPQFKPVKRFNFVTFNSPEGRAIAELTGIMESVTHLPRAEGSVPRRALKVPVRGASSHFVGSTIVILSSYAVATLAMNCGKKIQDQRMCTLKNWRTGALQL